MEAKELMPGTCSHEPHDCLGRDERCPLCARDNECRVAKGHLYKWPCWCYQVIVPTHILKLLVEDTIDLACLCRPCLETIARISRELNDTGQMIAEIRKWVLTSRLDQGKEPEGDYYFDDNGNTVFTASYHLKRGTCCHNQCRHCPY